MSIEAKLELDEEKYVESFRPNMMDIVHAWCKGCTFAHICTMTDIFEGVSYMLSFGNANVGDLYVNRRVSGKTAFYT